MSDPGQTIASRQSLTLDLPPSCIEFCPTHPSYLVIGTYNLQTEEPADAKAEGKTAEEDSGEDGNENVAAKLPQSRTGTLVVFNYVNGTIEQRQVISQPSAILDLHFCPCPGKEDILAVVSSTGTLAIFKLAPSGDDVAPLKHITTSTISGNPDGILFLSCAWSLDQHGVIAITASTGEVFVVRLDGSWNIVEGSSQALISHTLEAWTVAISATSRDATRETILYSGGDDSALRYGAFNFTEGEDLVQALSPPLVLEGHNAGVTAILPTPCRLDDGSNVIITGSYDDYMRIFAIQPPQAIQPGQRRHRLLASIRLGGGVWRLKLVNSHHETSGLWRATILASCMHAGARVVRAEGRVDGEDGRGWHAVVLARFEEHQSMNYASDFSLEEGDTTKLMCVSTSFYDKLLCVWDAPLG